MNMQFKSITEVNSVEAVTSPPIIDPRINPAPVTMPPKLTMKMLYTMLTELRQESILIAERVDEMEHRLSDMLQATADAAAASEIDEVEPSALEMDGVEPSAFEAVETECEPFQYQMEMQTASIAPIMELQDAPPVIQTFRFVSRSERHPKEAPGFWERLFRRIAGAGRKELTSP